MKCYCKSGKEWNHCCEPIILGESDAESSEQLMRSRYSAFCTKNFEYIIETHDPQTRKFLDIPEMKKWATEATFTNLEVIKTQDDGNKGVVEFKAFYHMNGEDHVHYEISKFRKQGGHWYFRDGKTVGAQS